MNAEYLEKKGLSIERKLRRRLCVETLTAGAIRTGWTSCKKTFNLRRPEDFFAVHSLSVSDIVALKQNGVVSCHYVDSWGFKALPDFLKAGKTISKTRRWPWRDDYGMIDGVINNGPKQAVAELEEQAKSGKPVSLMELAQAARREQAQASQQEKKPLRAGKALSSRQRAERQRVQGARKRAAMMIFTNDEMNLMCIYQSDSRSGLIAALTEMRG